jgi:hypothetical protein
MATRAAAPKTRAPKKADAAPAGPQRWWQYVLLYPTFFAAIVSASPDWIEKYKSYRLGVVSAAESEKQAALWQKNRECASLESGGYLSPSDVSVDATICKSGDILVRAVTKQNREIFKWLPLADVVPSATASIASGLIPPANAATITTGQASVRKTPLVPAYRIAQTVQCTRSDGRYLHRVVQTPNGCFHEVIDTFTGALVSRNQVPCGSGC